MRIRSLIASALVAATVVAVSVAAGPSARAATTSWDLATDWSGTTNPNGAWTYGWSVSRGAAFNLGNSQFSPGFEAWNIFWSGLPVVFKNITTSTLPTACCNPIPGGTVAVHPGPTGYNAVVRWTAAQAGSYHVVVTFTGRDWAGTTTDAAILRSGATAFVGEVTGYLATQTYDATLALAAGDRIDASVGFGTDGDYLSDTTGVAFTVTQVVTTPLTLAPATLPDATAGQAYGQTITASGGTAPFTFALTTGSSPLPAGLALSSAGVLSGTPSASGTATFTVQAIDAQGVTGTRMYTLTVSGAATTTTLTASPNPSLPIQLVTLTATVSPSSATGSVDFYDGALLIGSVPLTAGTATSPDHTFSPGTYSLTAKYSGDATHAASTSAALAQTVNKLPTTLTVQVSPSPSSVGDPVTFRTSLTFASGSAIPTGTVTFSEGATTLGSVSVDAAGFPGFTTSSLSAGSHLIHVSYSGDANFLASSADVTQVVKAVVTTTTTTLSSAPDPSTFGQSVTFTATVSPAGATGSVTFSDGATTLGTAALGATGTATFSTSALAAGAHSITAAYAGDAGHAASTSAALAQTVSKAATTITPIVVSPSPSGFGEPVTFSATVGSAAGVVPTGTVTFSEGATTLAANVALDVTGSASFTTSSLSAGSHLIHVSYSGDANFLASSADVPQDVVAAATTTTIASNNDPSTYGQSVTFAATVTAASGTPTGYVTFSDGPTTLATAPLDATGKATFSTSALVAGGHSITAAYGGGGNGLYLASTSAALTQTVNKDTPVITWPAPAAIMYGAALGDAQLDATASGNTAVLGSFAYSPAAGSVLAAGAQRLSVTFTPTDAADYTTATATVQLTVNTAPLTVTANNASKAYGTANPAFSAGYAGFVNGDTAASLGGTLVFATAATTTSAVGTYRVTPSGLTSPNYAITFVAGTLTIGTATVTASVTAADKTYDGTTAATITSCTLAGVVATDQVTCSVGSAAFATKTVGSGITVTGTGITLSGARSGDYALSSTTATTAASITARALTGSFTAANKVYDGTTAATITGRALANTVSGDDVALTAGSASFSDANAGTGKTVSGTGFTLAGTTASNYTLVSVATATADITPASASVTADNKSKSYGQADPPLTATVTGAIGNDTIAYTLSTTATPASSVGQYPIVVTLGSNPNYTVATTNGTLTITTAQLTITANNASKTYGQTLTFQGTEFTASGLVNGDTVASVTLTSAGAAADAAVSGGPYSIVPSNAVAGANTSLANYQIGYLNGQLSVGQAKLTVTADSKTRIYGDPDPTLTATFSGFANGETLATSGVTGAPALSTTATPASPVGTYTITAAIGTLASGNYSFTFASGTLSIGKKAATVTPNAASKVYGSADPTLTGTLSGFLAADGVTATYSRTAGEHVAASPYTIGATLSPAPVLANYQVTYNAAQFTITPAPLTIAADDKTKAYGAALPALTVTYTGLTSGDTPATFSSAPNVAPAVTTTATGASHVAGSPYTITARGAADPDYTISYLAGPLEVTPVALTITASSDTKVYGTTDSVSPSYAGFVSGDTAASLATAPTCSSAGTAATAGVSGSPYPTTCTGAADADYVIGYVDGTLTVTKAPTNTTLASAPNPSELNVESVTFAATVATNSGSVATGAVTFSDGATTLATVPLDAAGSASLTTTATTLGLGAHTIAAAYSGDGNHLASQGALTHVVRDTIAPVSTAAATPAANASGWNAGNVTVRVSATDAGTGVASTTVLLDGVAAATSFTIASEGVHTIAYQSTDKAGNVEEARTLIVRIDRTSPEAGVRFDPATRSLDVFGRDGGSGVDSVTLISSVPATDAENGQRRGGGDRAERRTYRITDKAGNATTLVVDVRAAGHEIKAAVASVAYGTGVVTALDDRVAFQWSPDKPGAIRELEQRMAVESGTDVDVRAKFEAEKGMTIIEIKTDGGDDRHGVKTVERGLVLLRLVTERGQLQIEH